MTGIVSILGTEFDDPREFPPPARDCSERKEGARTSVKEMWVSSYRRDGTAVWCEKIPLTMTNRGVCTFDGRPVKDEADRKLVAELFASVTPA